MAKIKIPKTKPKGALPSGASRIGDVEYDPRFDPRVKEQERIKNTEVVIEPTSNVEPPTVSLVDYEGYPFVTSMSDRTRAGGVLTNIEGVELNRPVELLGGQDYMFNNPGQVWASGAHPVRQVMAQAAALKEATGRDPLYMPWRMAPTGGDFASMAGETMLNYAEANMGKRAKQRLDKQIKTFIPDWAGVDSDKSIEQFRSAPDTVRKTIKQMMDVDFREEGGLNIGQARLATADPRQYNAPDSHIMNVGRIFADKPMIMDSGHVWYPRGIPGEGIGIIDQPRSIFELLPDYAKERGIPDPSNPRQTDIRSMQMKPYGGIISEELLRKLGYREGGMVDQALVDKVNAPAAKAMLEMDLARLAVAKDKMQPKKMAKGGKLPKAVLPAAKRAENLERMLMESKIKDRLYHVTPKNFSEFNKPGEIGASSGDATWMSPDPDYLPAAHNVRARGAEYREGTNVMPLHIESKNPLILDDKTMLDWARATFADDSGVFPMTMNPEWAKSIKDAGYDSIKYSYPVNGEIKTEVIGLYPEKIKSAIGNVGTYDTSNPDITKKAGGKVQKMAVGGSPFSGGSLYQDEEREREFRETPSYDAMSMSGHIPAFSVYNKPTYASSIPGALPSANQERREYTVEGMIEAENRERVKNRDYLSTIDPAGTLGVADVFSTIGKGMLSVPAQIAGNVVDYFRSGKVTPESEKRREEAIGEWAAPKTQEGAEFLGEMMSIPEKLTGSSMGAGSHPFLWVHGIGTPSPAQMKAGLRLASEKAAPVARNIDTAVRRGYESGMIPQPGMSIKDVGTFTSEKPMPSVDELGFYSPAEAAAMNIQRKSGTGQSFINDLMKQENVRQEELDAIGLNDWLADKKTVSADEVRNYINENRIQLKENRYSGKETKYADYSMPGGQNYREVTLSLPDQPINQYDQYIKTLNRKYGEGFDTDVLSDAEKQNIRNYWEMAQSGAGSKYTTYQSSHWKEPNVVAHIRMKDFNDAEGKKVLLVDEVQSDWHQEGREAGYSKQLDPSKLTVKSLDTDNPNDVGVYDQSGNEIWVGSASGNKDQIINKAIQDLNSGTVPDAPFKDTWYQLALKRAIKEAADNGYDRVALPTGDRVADRFDLQKKIDSLSYMKTKTGNYQIMIMPKGESEFVNMGGFTPDELSNVIGKDMATKVVEGKGNKVGSTGIYTFPKIDITVGGEGMKKYYDDVYPSYLKKFAKKHGANFGETKINADGEMETVRYMDITPSMRESIQKGVPYKKGGAVDKPSKMRHNSQNLTAKQPSLDVMRLALQKRG